MRRWTGCVLTALALWCTHAGAACELPSPRDPAKSAPVYRVVMGPSWAGFDARAFMHDFAGRTPQIEGTIRVSDADRLSDAEACIRMDAASLDTGNSTRDGIMRNDHLETARFPTIDFLLKAVDGVTRQGETWEFTATGMLSLHGVNREIRFALRARQEGETVRLTGRLPLRMSDYGIRTPRLLFLAVDDEVMVSFDLIVKRAQP